MIKAKKQNVMDTIVRESNMIDAEAIERQIYTKDLDQDLHQWLADAKKAVKE